MNMVAKRYSRRLAFGLLTASLFACTPSINKLGVSKEVVENLPKNVALSFLVTVHSTGSNPECLFLAEGVQAVSGGKLSSEIKPYQSLVAGLGPGRFGGGHLSLYGPGTGVYCLFGGSREASRQGMDNKSFLKKVFTALLAVGVGSEQRTSRRHSVRTAEPNDSALRP